MLSPCLNSLNRLTVVLCCLLLEWMEVKSWKFCGIETPKFRKSWWRTVRKNNLELSLALFYLVSESGDQDKNLIKYETNVCRHHTGQPSWVWMIAVVDDVSLTYYLKDSRWSSSTFRCSNDASNKRHKLTVSFWVEGISGSKNFFKKIDSVRYCYNLCTTRLEYIAVFCTRYTRCLPPEWTDLAAESVDEIALFVIRIDCHDAITLNRRQAQPCISSSARMAAGHKGCVGDSSAPLQPITDRSKHRGLWSNTKSLMSISADSESAVYSRA